MRSLRPLLVVLAAGLVARSIIVPATSLAQDPPKRYREAVTFDTNSVISKKFSGAQDYLNARQWTKAIEVIADIADDHTGTVIAVSHGRYVNVALYCQLILAGLPADAIAAYRLKADPLARQWYEAGEKGDQSSLERILREAFVSSFGDDAAMLLAERAWDRGEFTAARRYWEMLIPLEGPTQPGKPIAALRHPDPSMPRTDVLARLILCSLLEGHRDRAERELDAFVRQSPEATGQLAGREGNLAEILRKEFIRLQIVPSGIEDVSVPTYAGSPRRTAQSTEAPDVGAVEYRFPLSKLPFVLPRGRTATGHADTGPLATYPAVLGDLVFVNSADEIFAWNYRTGKPAWPNGVDESGLIYPSTNQTAGHTALPIEPVGVPRFTMTIHEGQLYARMGTVVTGRRRNEFRELKTRIVCLDVARNEGRVQWEKLADEVHTGDANWAFEGSPVVDNGRVYALMRKSQPQTQFNVVCLDAAAEGRLLWSRKVCTAVSALSEGHNIISHHLLTLDEGMLFCSTDLGAVAAVDAHTGELRWASTYETRETPPEAGFNDHLPGLLPCIASGGTVIAAPNDTNSVMAFDSQTGALRWERRLRGGVRHLLGVTSEGLLIASGERLWGVDVETGEIVWPTAGTNPGGPAYGRGVIAGNSVFVPLREELQIIDHRRVVYGERLQRRVPLRPDRNVWGGNLTAAGDHLLIAQSDELAVLCDHGLIRERIRQELSKNPESPQSLLKQARDQESSGEMTGAFESFQAARKASLQSLNPSDRAVAGEAGRRAAQLLESEAGRKLRENDVTTAQTLLRQSAEQSTDLASRARRLVRLAEIDATPQGGEVSIQAGFEVLADPALSQQNVGTRSAGRMGRIHVTAGRAAQQILLGWMRRERASVSQQLEHAPAAVRARLEKLDAQNADQPVVPKQARSPPWKRSWTRSVESSSQLIIPEEANGAAARPVVLLSGSHLECLDCQTGRTLWLAPSHEPVRWSRSDGTTLILGTNRRLRAVALQSGLALWDLPLREPAANFVHSSDIGDDVAFLPCATGIACLTESSGLVAVDDRNGEIIWRWEPPRKSPGAVSTDLGQTVALNSGLLFQVSGQAVRLDAYERPLPELHSGRGVTHGWRSQPVFAKKNGAVVSVDRTVYGINRHGQPVWTYPGPTSWVNAEPAIVSNGDALLLILEGDTLIRLSEASGVPLWRRTISDQPIADVTQAVAVDSDRFYAVGDGILRAFALGDGRLVWEEPAGSPDRAWRARVNGGAVLAWPTMSDGSSAERLLAVECSTGRRIQQLHLKVPEGGRSKVEVNFSDGLLLVETNRQVTAFVPWSAR